MARSLKKGPYVHDSLIKKIEKLNEANDEQEIYIVKVGTWRALIAVSPDSRENILTLS